MFRIAEQSVEIASHGPRLFPGKALQKWIRGALALALMLAAAGAASAQTNAERMDAALHAYRRGDHATVRANLDPYLREIPHDRMARLMNGYAHGPVDPRKAIEHLTYVLDHFNTNEDQNCDARYGLIVSHFNMDRPDLGVNEADRFVAVCRCHPQLTAVSAILWGGDTPLTPPRTEGLQVCSHSGMRFHAEAEWESDLPVMETGKTYTVTVKMKNPLKYEDFSGRDPGEGPARYPSWWWSGTQWFQLGTKHPHWGAPRVHMDPGEIVRNGLSRTFTFEVTAPLLPGVYPWQWQMLMQRPNEEVHWFGAATPLRHVTVREASCEGPAPPTVSIITPRAGRVTKPRLALAVNAADDGAVFRVEYLLDGQVIAASGVAPFSASADVSATPLGIHTLTAKAFDVCSNVVESVPVRIDLRPDAGRPPDARNDRVNSRRDTPVTVNVLANDRSGSGLPLALTEAPITVAPRKGTASRVSDTSITYTPTAGSTGNDTFQYQIRDTAGRLDRAWVTVRVGRTKALPIAEDDSVSTVANRGVTIEVLANDRSPDGDALVLVASPIIDPPQHGAASRLSDNTVTYTPVTDFVGEDSFEYEMSDGEGGTASARVNILVAEGNRPPVAVNDAITTGVGRPVTLDVVANDTDADGDILALVNDPFVVGPTHGAVMRVSATRITYTPHPGYVGGDSLQYEVGDGNGRRGRGTVAITVTNTNRAPQAVDDTAVTGAAVALTVNVTANDSDPDGEAVMLVGSPVITAPTNGTAVKVTSASITYTPRSGFTGLDRFQYEVGDGSGSRARAWVNITVGTGDTNRNPVAVDDVATTRLSSNIDVVVTTNDFDPDGDLLSLIDVPIIVAPGSGTASRLNATTIRYAPNGAFTGVDTLQYEIGDGRGKRARGWLRVTVEDVNNRPVAADDVVFIGAGRSIDIVVIANDSDPDGDSLSLPASTVVAQGQNGTATRLDGSRIRYSAHAGFIGTDRFQYEVGDGRGGRHRAWVNVTISANAAGTLSALSTTAAIAAPPRADNDLAESSGDGSTPLVVLINDVSVDGKAVRLTASPVLTPPLFGSVVRTSDTTFTYTPPSGFQGNDRFEYQVTDSAGVTSSAWVAVQVPSDNQPPVAVGDVRVVPMNLGLSVAPLVNDADPNGDVLVLSDRAVTAAPQHGSTRREGDLRIAYTPHPGFTGTDSFVYEVTDRRGGTAEATAIVRVVDPSRPPIAQNDAVSVESGKAVSLNVLANDTDPDGGALRVIATVPPQKGSVVWGENGAVTYRSIAPFVGTDSFRYTVADSSGATAQAEVRLSVHFSNQLTLAAADAAETKTRTPVLIGVLANDWDADGQKLTVTSVTQPSGGTAVIHAGTAVMYAPAANFAGVDTFSYVVSDGFGSVTAKVAVTVTNQVPNPRADQLTALEDTSIGFQSLHLLSNDTDPDGDELRVVSIEQPVNGTFQVVPDNTQFSYRPKANWFGLDNFYYTVGDPFGAQVRVLAHISVAGVNDPPVPSNDTFSVYRNQVLTITEAQVVANDTDLENHAISVYSVGAATNGTTTKLADGSIEYRPHGEYVGSDSFEYTVTDSGGNAYGMARITVNVLQDMTPVPNFTVTCNSLACTFDASSSTDDRGIVSYQWVLGNGQTAAGKTLTYSYPAAGAYTVRLTIGDTLGQTAVLSKAVIVCQTLEITAHPVSQTINQFGTATFTVSAGGSGPLSYQWFEGASGATTIPVGTNSNSFTTPALTASRSYWVRVTSTCKGTVSANSNAGTANVCLAPGIAAQPASKTINYNTATSLTVTPSGSGPFSYQWYEGNAGTTTKPLGTNSNTFTTPALKASTAYWVRVTSMCNGSATANSTAATITVTGALARRQKASALANSQTSVTANWSQPTQAGTLLVAVISASRTDSGYPVATFAAPGGWQMAVTSEWNNVKTSIYYFSNNPGGRTSETFTTGAFRDQILQLAEYEGVLSLSPLDKIALSGDHSPAAGGAVHTGVTPITAQARELVVTAVAAFASATFSEPSDSFVEIHDQSVGSSLAAAVHERLTVAAGTYGHTAKLSSAVIGQWVGAVATFRATDTSASAVGAPAEVLGATVDPIEVPRGTSQVLTRRE